MRTVPEYVIEERLPSADPPVPLLQHVPAARHDRDRALRMFDALVRTDAELYGPHTGNRLVLKQVAPTSGEGGAR